MSFNPYEDPVFMERVHEDAPIERNLSILYKNIMIGNKPFLDLFWACALQSGMEVPGWKIFRRTLRALNLAQYADSFADVEGGWAECGIYSGFSALMVAEIQRMRSPVFSGDNLHLVDSYEGLSHPTINDATEERDMGRGVLEPYAPFKPGHFAVDLERVQQTMQSYPGTSYYKGWIPDVLSTLPEQKWAFVHIDVDLYEPTKGCLEYFVPRMSKGGCIINDDFASPRFPGGGIAWQEYCDEHGLSYAILDSGQSALIIA